MSNKIKNVKVIYEDGSISKNLPIGAYASNVDMENGHSVEYEINNLKDNFEKIENKLSKKEYFFNSIEDMINDFNLKENDIIRVGGIKKLGDSKQLSFKIIKTSTKIENDDFTITLANNELKALMIKNEGKFFLYQPKLSDESEMGCFNILHFSDGFNILFDCGFTGQENAIRDYLSEKKINYFNIVVITHFHGDHVGCFDYIARNYCDKNTLFFRQMECDYTKLTVGESAAKTYDDNYKNLISTLGYNSRIPNQNEVIKVNNNLIQLRFLNTDTSFRNGYYTSESDTNTTNYKKSSLNNFSLICEVSAFDKKILMTGDIETQAQKNNASFITKCDVMQVPHHSWNHNGYHEFFKRVSPSVAYFNRNTKLPDNFIYWTKVQKQCLGYIPTYYTFDNHVEIEFSKNNCCNVLKGSLDTSYDIPMETNQFVSYIPYYTNSSENYWGYADWTIKDICKMLADVPEVVSCHIFSGTRHVKFFNEVTSISGKPETTWIATSFSRGIKLKRASNWDGEELNFLSYFDFSDPTTYYNGFYRTVIPFSNNSVNDNLNISVGDPAVKLSKEIRDTQSLHIKVKMSNGNTYNLLAKKSWGTNQYEVNDFYCSTNAGTKYLRMIKVVFSISDQNLTLLTCEGYVYDLNKSSLGTDLTGVLTYVATTTADK